MTVVGFSIAVALVSSATAIAAPTAPRFDPATPTEQATAVAALAAAKATGKSVEILDRRTEMSTLFREPDGSYTLRSGFEPVRVRQNDAWVPIDTNLETRADGTIAPKAATVGLRLSGGGNRPLAVMSDEGAEMALRWPHGSLPKPRIEGDTAVYPDVLPGVDLKVTARHSGFSELFVVKTPAAARNPLLKKIKLGLTTNGLTPRVDGITGAFTATDNKGKVRFSSGTAQAWSEKSQPDPATKAKGSSASSLSVDQTATAEIKERLTPVKVEASPDTLAIIPEAGFLDAPADQFPLVIDPEFWGSTNGNWTTIVTGPNGQNANSSFWNGMPPFDNGRVKVGRLPGDAQNRRARSLFQLETSAANGKIVEHAEFWIWHKHSWTCAARPATQVMLTGPISHGTTWNNRPEFVYATARTPFQSSCDNWHKYDVTHIAQQAANSWWPATTFGMQAQNENDKEQWRKYNGDAGSPQVMIRFRDQPQPPPNRQPNAPTDLSTVPATPCGTGSNRAMVGAGELRFSARVSDPDGNNIDTFLDFYGKGAEGHHPTAPGSGMVTPGSTVTWTVPPGYLKKGVVYEYRARSFDGSGFGPYSQTCEIEVDGDAPTSAPKVTSTDYPNNPSAFFGSVGRTGTFTFDAAGNGDVTGFLYGLKDPPTTPVVADASHRASIKITPGKRGPNTLFVRSRDAAGNPGPVTTYMFNVNAEADPVGWWAFDESTGTTAADGSGANRTLTANKAVSWTPASPASGGNAVSLSGADAYLSTQDRVVDATGSFAVAAWVRPSRIDAGRWPAVISQDGTRSSTFSLRFGGDEPRWTFTMMGADTDNPAHTNLRSVTPVATGQWTHVAAVYDAATRESTLYVDGIVEDNALILDGGFAGNGPLAVGRDKWSGILGSPWAGDIDDAVAWDRALSEDEVLAIASGGMRARAKATLATGSGACIPEEGPDRSVDGVIIGDPRAKFCTWANDKWLQLQLDKEQELSNVIIRHASSGGEDIAWNTRDFDIQTSTNGTSWTTVAEVRGNTGGTTNSVISPQVRALHVRIKVITASQVEPQAARIFEVGIYAKR